MALPPYLDPLGLSYSDPAELFPGPLAVQPALVGNLRGREQPTLLTPRPPVQMGPTTPNWQQLMQQGMAASDRGTRLAEEAVNRMQVPDTSKYEEMARRRREGADIDFK